VISWESYPQWRADASDTDLAARVAFLHDLNRSLKGGRPFMLMESTPSTTNWARHAKLKRPGMHRTSSLQAVAHGADTVQYFQWRKSRGSSEKFHGAVVDHCGHENHRVFRDVAEVGDVLKKLDPVLGTTVRAQVAVVFDWENRWAMTGSCGPTPAGADKGYEATCVRHYRSFWARGIAVDVIDMTSDLSRYDLVIAPMLYMTRPGTEQHMREFVTGGGTLVTTYFSGRVDENDLCHLGGFPGPLRDLAGIWIEEIDALHPEDANAVVPVEGNPLELSGEYRAGEFCDLIHAENAEVLATYGQDFYAGRPAVTVNRVGEGRVYFIASRNEDGFLKDFYGAVSSQLGLTRVLSSELPHGVSAQARTDGTRDFVFLLNFSPDDRTVEIGDSFTDMLAAQPVGPKVDLPPFGSLVLERKSM